MRAAQSTPLGWKLVARQSVAPLIAIGLIALFWRQAQDIDTHQITRAFALITPLEWLSAAFLTSVSFCAVGLYDRFWHAYLSTGVKPQRAWSGGMAAVAVAQTTGFGLIVGTLMRWRLQPGISIWRASQITLLIAISFLSGLGVLAALALSFVPLPGLEWMRPVALTILALVAAGVILAVLAPANTVAGWLCRTLPLRAFGYLFLIASVDALAAGAALIVLIPGDITTSLSVLLPAVLVASALGYLSGMPCGIGAMDVALLGFIGHADTAPILAALVAFRALYFGVTAVIGCIWAVIGTSSDVANSPKDWLSPVPAAAFLGYPLESWLENAPRAEAGLIRQGHLGLIQTSGSQGGWAACDLDQCTVAIGDPIGPVCQSDAMLSALVNCSASHCRSPVIYKTSPRIAVVARKQGFRVWPLAQEAWINPANFSTQGSNKSSLRRKLRKSLKSGIEISRGGDILPLIDMEKVSAEWCQSKGGERGFSVGRYDVDYVASQQVWLARQNGALVAWISLHQNRQEVTLDIMRHVDSVPEGTMQALLSAALVQARDDGRRRFSLASLPDQSTRARRWLNTACDTGGLSQFKRMFDPKYETLYVAAPSFWALFLAALDIRRAICMPEPPKYNGPINMKLPHDLYDKREIAS